jgi:hypothetical protein
MHLCRPVILDHTQKEEHTPKVLHVLVAISTDRHLRDAVQYRSLKRPLDLLNEAHEEA